MRAGTLRTSRFAGDFHRQEFRALVELKQPRQMLLCPCAGGAAPIAKTRGKRWESTCRVSFAAWTDPCHDSYVGQERARITAGFTKASPIDAWGPRHGVRVERGLSVRKYDAPWKEAVTRPRPAAPAKAARPASCSAAEGTNRQKRDECLFLGADVPAQTGVASILSGGGRDRLRGARRGVE